MPTGNNGLLEGIRKIGARFRDVAIDGGLPGAPLGYRLRGATRSGPPVTGTWTAGDQVPDRNGTVWTCITGGTGQAAAWQGSLTGLAPSGDATGAADYRNIQGLLNLAVRSVTLQAGQFYVNAALSASQSIRLSGAGSLATVVSQVAAGANGLTLTDVSSVTICDLTLSGPGSGTGIGIAGVLSVNSSLPYLDFRDIRVQSFGGNGIDLAAAIVTAFYQVVSASNGGHGFALHSPTTSTSVTFTSCYALSNAGHGYDLNGVNYSSLTGCASDSNGYGYVLTSCLAVTLTSCGAESVTTDSFVLTGGRANSLVSCRSYQNNHYGVHVTGSEASALVTGFMEDTPLGGAVNSIITDSGTTSFVINWSTSTALSLGGVCTNIDAAGNFATGSGGSCFFSTVDVFGPLNLEAQSTSTAPAVFTGGSLLTTPAAGAMEYDGTALYFTAAGNSRQVADAEQFQCLSGSRTFTNNTSAQAVFNATANGALTLAGSTTYDFECLLDITGLSSSSHTVNFGFGGTATFTSLMYEALTSTSSGGAASLFAITTASATAITASTTGTVLLAKITGTLRVNAGGTVIPQLTQVTASAAAVVAANSRFRCWPVGSNTVTNVGNWS